MGCGNGDGDGMGCGDAMGCGTHGTPSIVILTLTASATKLSSADWSALGLKAGPSRGAVRSMLTVGTKEPPGVNGGGGGGNPGGNPGGATGGGVDGGGAGGDVGGGACSDDSLVFAGDLLWI